MSIRNIFRASKPARTDKRHSQKKSRRQELRKRLLGHENLEQRRLLTTFANVDSIMLDNAAPAATYPSSIEVSGLNGTITDVNVQIEGFSHDSPDDVGLMLVDPNGTATILMRSVGGLSAVSSLDVTFDAQAATEFPDSGELVSGSFLPTVGTPDEKSEAGTVIPRTVNDFPSPAPQGASNTDLTLFNGVNANGEWKLYAFDDHDNDIGELASGWSLQILTTDPVFVGDGTDNQFELRVNAGDNSLVDIIQDGTVTTVAAATLNSITFAGGDGDDSLSIDFSNGNPIPAGGFSFDGGGQATPAGDSLTLDGYTGPIGTTTYTFVDSDANGFNGQIEQDGNLITFAGLEPIINAGVPTDIIFDLPAIANLDAVLSNDPGTVGGSQLTGSTFEDTFFMNPTGSLTINSSNAADVIGVEGLDPSFTADLQVDAAAGGLVRFQTSPTNIAAGALLVNAGTIEFNQPITAGSVVATSTGAMTINQNITVTGNLIIAVDDSAGAADSITATGATLQSNTGDILLSAGDDIDVQASATLNAPAGAVTVEVDHPISDSDIGVGATVTLAGTINAPVTNVSGGNDNDTFVPTPQATTSFSIDGQSPVAPASPGDTLIVDAAGNPMTVTESSVNVGGGQIDYLSIETFDLQNPGAVTITGTAANNTLLLTRGSTNDSVAYSLDGAAPIEIQTSNVIFEGLDGDDSVIVDFDANGMFTTSVQFNGGLQSGVTGDELSIFGTVQSQVLNYIDVGPNGNNGNIILSDGGLTTTITYDGLEPIVAGNAADTTLNLPLGTSNNATLQNSVNPGEIEIVDNGATFENTVIPNPTNSLTVKLGDQGDQLQITTLDTAYAASLIITGGLAINDNVQLTNVDLINTPGRGLQIDQAETIGITGGEIAGNNAGGASGGGIWILDGSAGMAAVATISGTSIHNNQATFGGGISATPGNVDLNLQAGTSINNNFATDAGGGVEFFSAGTLTIDGGVDISDNSASNSGGGIYIANSSATIGAATIAGNISGLTGGGIASTNSVVTIDGATIENNTASGALASEGGGGIFNIGGMIDVANAFVTDNAADGAAGSGGGILNAAGGTLTVTNTLIDGNTAVRAGGGIEDNSGPGLGITLTNVNLDNNSTSANPGNGGGLHITGPGDSLITDGTVSGNTAAAEGGGLWNGTGTMTIDGTTIIGNTASGALSDQGGGGVFNSGGFINIDNATIIANIADGAAGSGGGILNDAGGTLTVTNTLIEGNTAVRAGGGIEDNSGPGLGITLTNVNLDNNSTSANPGNGGGLHITGAGDSLITDGTVSGNTATTEGGGLWNGSGTMTIDGTTIENNTANGGGFDQGGGGIFNAGGTLDVIGATINANFATNSPAAGGGILSDGGVTNVSGSTITNNDNYGIRIIDGSGNITSNNFAGNITADLLIDGTNAADLFNIDPTSVAFGANLVTYDGTVPDLDVRGLDGDDTFNVSPSVDTQIFIDGGSPVVPASPGDTLNLFLQNEANVYSDKAVPPNVSITTTVGGVETEPVTFISIESFLAAPGNPSQTVNFIGDNNNTVDQTDNLVIVGRDVDGSAAPIPGAQPEFQPDADGDNEFSWSLNGSPIFGFRNVSFLNYNSGELVDTLEVTPYADDRPQGWDIDVFYNEGAPVGADGDQIDLLIYHTSAFGGAVSENIVVKPSGPDNGELIVTNASDGSLIVDIDFVNNTDIIIDDNDGFLNDTDTLTLLGTDGSTPQTSGDETVVANFTAAGTLGNNIVNVSDSVSGLLLYGIRDINNIDVVNFDLLDGNDEISILGRLGGGVGGDIDIDTVNVFGGAGNDTLILDNTDGLSDMPGGITYAGGTGNDQLMLVGPNAIDSSTYDIGPTADAGTVTHVRGPETQVVHFSGLEPVVDLVVAATLTVNANAAANAITYSQSELNPAWGKIAIDGFEPIHFSNKTTLVINAAGGGDTIRLDNATLPTGLTDIVVNGGGSAGDSVELIGSALDDTFVYTPNALDGGVITQAGGVALTYTLNSVNALALNTAAEAGADALTVTTQNATITPGTDPGTGIVDPVTLGGAPLLSLAYQGVENATVSGTATVIQGTNENDTIEVTAAGIVTVTNELGFSNSVDVSAFTSVVINALGGDDNITVTPSANLTVSVIGGDNGDGSDTLTFNGTGGDLTLDLAAQTVTEAGIAGSTMSYTGIENLNVNAGAGALLITGTAGNDNISITPTATGGILENNGNGLGIVFTAAGAVTVDSLGGNDTVVVHGDSADNTFAVSDTAITVDALTTINLIAGSVQDLVVLGGAGGDTFNVTQSDAVSISVEGGDPVGVTGDTLVLTPFATPTFAAGPESDAGGFSAAGAADISFDQIESITVDLAGVAGLGIVSGTGDDDHITATGTAAGTVEVQVNDGPIATYTNVTNITLQGQNGDDDIVVDAGLAGAGVAFTVESGSSTNGSDTLTVLSVAGLDNLTLNPTSQGAGTIDHSAASGTVTYSGTENVELVGQFGEGDSLAVTGTDGEDLFEYFSAPVTDSGTIEGTMNLSGSPFTLPTVSFTGMNPFAARMLGSAIAGENDNVVFFATEMDDEVSFDGAGNLTNSIAGNLINSISLMPSIGGLLIVTGDGSDAITLTPSPDINVVVQAGNPGAGSDVLNFVGTGGPITLDLEGMTIAEAGLGPVSFSGVEHLNVDALGGNLTVLGTVGDDDFSVTPTGTNAGSLQLAGQSLTVDFNNTGDVSLDGLAGSNAVLLHANNAANTITISDAAVTVDALETINLVTASVQDLVVMGGAGGDTFNVTQSDSVSISVEGGDPVGVIGDTLVLTPFATPTFAVGSEPGAGGFSAAGAADVSFEQIESLMVNLAGVAGLGIVNGTGDDDHITATGTAAGTVEVQVNDGPIVTYTSATNITLLGKNGDDDIIIDAGLAGAGVVFTADGGSSTAGSDTLTVVSLAGFDPLVVTPTAQGTGSVSHFSGGAGNVAYLGIEEIELVGQLADTDSFGIDGTAGDDRFEYLTGPALDTGTVRGTMNQGAAAFPLPIIRFSGVARASVVRFNLFGNQGGNDTFVYVATDGADSITYNGAGFLTNNPGTLLANIEIGTAISAGTTTTLLIEAQDGDDTINVTPEIGVAIIVNGNNPGASDTLNFNGTGGPVTLDLAGMTITEAGLGPVSFSGVEHLNVDALGGNLTILGTVGDDDFSVTPTGTNAGSLQLAGQSLAVDFSNTGDVSLDGLAGSNAVLLHANNAANTIAISDAAVTVDALETINLVTASVQDLVVMGGAGGDTFNVTQSDSVSISVAGGDPVGVIGDTLVLTPFATPTFAVGAEPGAGGFSAAGAADVSFGQIESLVVNLAGVAGLGIISGTGDDDHITATGTAAGTVEVQVNDGPIATYTNATNITLQGQNGDDDIVVDAGLAGAGVAFTVESGSSTNGSDTLTVLSVPGLDNLTLNPTSQGAGTIDHSGAAGTVTYSGTENVELVGQLGEGDSFAVTGTDGEDLFEYFSAPLTDSGTIEGTMNISATPFTLPTVSFAGMNPLAARVLGSAIAGESDNVVFFATEMDDEVGFDGAGNLTNSIDGNLINSITLMPSISDLLIVTGDGSDAITVTPSAVINVSIQAGNPSAGSDSLNFQGTGGDVVLDLQSLTVTEVGLAPVRFTGVEQINVDSNGGNLTVLGTVVDDDLTVTPFDANSGQIEHVYGVNRSGQPWAASDSPLVTYQIGGGQLMIDTAAGEDTLNVVGNALPQTFDVNVLTGTVAIDDGPVIDNNGTVTWTNAESLGVFGLEGDDTFNVTPGQIPVFIDGGDPIGSSAGDLINVLAGGMGVLFEAGPENDEGGILNGANERVSFDHIEAIGVIDALCAVIVGTNGDDDITVIARDASTNAGTDGVQDFTVSVNDGIAILFTDVPDLYIDALSGDDDIVVRTAAPNLAAWDVNVFVAGGAPSDGAPNEGDRLVVETPGQDNLVYTPTGSDTGTVLIDDNGNGIDDGTDSLITIGAFVAACPGLDHTSDPGGVELLELDGEGAGDVLTVVGTAGDDTIVHTPGAVGDEGAIRVNTLLGIQYQNLGADATLNIDGGDSNDTLVVNGTGSDDAFDVAATTGAVSLITPSATYLALNQTGIENLTLDGLDGNDDFVVNQSQPYANINVFGGGPGGSDVLTVSGAAGTDEEFTVTPGFDRGDGQVSIVGGGVLAIPYIGVEHVALRANPDDSDNLTVNDDASDNLWTVDAGPIFGDRIQIDARESIDFDGFNDVDLVNFFGADIFTIFPANLVGFSNELTANSSGTGQDVLHVVGTEAADTFTSDADTITLSGKNVTAGDAGFAEVQVSSLGGADTITLSLALDGVRKVIDAGAGDDDVDVSAMLDATIFGGLGDDIIVGSPIADLIYGGGGNDLLIGLGGDDTIYGGDGNDRILGGVGNDNLFGGDGSDTFTWDNGDNDDIVEGDEGVDVQIVNGAGVGDDFTLSAIQSGRTLFERTNLIPFMISTGGVEQFDVNGLAGADTFAVGDLTQTDVEVVNLDLGAAADLDAVTVQGRTTDDALRVTNSNGVLAVQGLPYDINVSQSSLADGDTLAVNGNEGNDAIDIQNGVQAVSITTINGGTGNDLLTGWFNTANGGAGDDFIRGADNDQMIHGGDGEDTMIGGAGADTFDGGTGFDTIQIEGTSANNVIDVFQAAPTTLQHTVDGDLQTDTLVASSVEQALILAGQGADLIRVNWLDAHGVNASLNDSLRMTVVGGDDATSDRLVVVDDGTDDLVVYRKGASDDRGSVEIGPGNAEPLLNVFSEIERIDFVDETGASIVNNEGGSQLAVFKHDPFESNDDRFNATYLGSGQTINVDPTIDPGPLANPFGDGQDVAGDQDFYRVVAETTGTLDFQVYFRQVGNLASGRPGLPNDGNLDINVLDANGNIIAGFGLNDANDNERVRIPAVEGQTYYLQVFGNAGNAINAYNFSVVNHAAPTPFDIELADNLTILTGSQENPPVITPATGTANFQYDAVANTFDLDLFVSGVELTNATDLPEFVAAHIHNGAVGVNGPVIQALSAGIAGWVQEPSGIRLQMVGVPFTGAPADITALLAGNTYINVHSSDNAGGEVRGQINVQNVSGVSDSGRSQFDNITHDNTPTILLRLDDAILLNDLPGNAIGVPGADAPDQMIAIPHNPSTAASPVGLTAGYRVAIYDETDTHNPVLLGYAQPIANLNGVYSFTFTDPLTDGSHFISSRVQIIDPADNDAAPATVTPATGFAPRSLSLEVIVDTVAPPASFGEASIAGDGLHPSSDSGVIGVEATYSDGITNDLTPTFFGYAEANSVVRAYVDVDGDGVIGDDDVLIGQTVAQPLDGSNQFPNGSWELTSNVNFNHDPRLAGLGIDGQRTVLLQTEDVSGNLSSNDGSVRLDVFIDTAGPQVTDVYITNAPGYDLFELKPDGIDQGPTPAITSLTVDVQDLPARTAAFLYAAIEASATLDGRIHLIGDHSGIISIAALQYVGDPPADGMIATGRFVLLFDNPLPDDRYTLTLEDSLSDPAGNALDGEGDFNEPNGFSLFNLGIVSGDGVPGGDFVARFTVDSRPEIATWSQGTVYADINGNFVWDPEGQDNDASNRDFIYHFGQITDAYFAGNFAPAGAVTASGYDKVGTYGFFNGDYQFFLDTDDNGAGDTVGSMYYQVNAIPVAGNFNAAHPGDEIGAFDGQFWYLDTNGNNQIDAGERFATELRGIPVVGDFNGDGQDDLATFNNDTGTFQFDLDRNGTVDDTLNYYFNGFGEKPVAGDMNLDGIDDIVLWVPNRQGQLPKEAGEFHFLVSDRQAALPSTVFDPYSPAPLGNDLVAQFGDEFALPLLGNFDPPVGSSEPLDTTGWFTNLRDPADVNNDGFVTPLDALTVINALNRGITSASSAQAIRVLQSFGGDYLDVDANGSIAPLDALRVINVLNRQGRLGSSQGESSAPQGEAASSSSSAASYAAAVDAVFSDSDDDDDELLLEWADAEAQGKNL